MLGVSRNAVWKAILKLKSEGYPIESVPNRGYVLSSSGDVIRKETISGLLQTKSLGRELELLESIDSTNSYLKRNADSLVSKNGYTVVALEQTAGRGRMQRAFYSPAQNGIYMSFFLEPHIAFSDINLITVLTVAAVCRAIEKTMHFHPDVKWVNDVLYQGKKLCGILTEASVEAESGLLKYLIVGIGININSDKNLPPELHEIVGSLNEFSDTPCNRNQLIAEMLNEFEALYTEYLTTDKANVLQVYRSYLNVFGTEYNVVSFDSSYSAVPVDLDDDAHLIVKDQIGELHTLNSGEISIRKA